MKIIWYSFNSDLHKQNNVILMLIQLYKLMNITSSVPSGIQSSIESLHRLYIQAKEDPSEITSQRDIKFKSKIRIKSKSQGKFIADTNRQSNKEQMCKTINLMAIVKQTRTNEALKIAQRKKANFLPEQQKPNNPQRELLFLKQLVNRRRQMPKLNRNQFSRSQSQSHLNQSNLNMKAKYELPTPVSRPQQKALNHIEAGVGTPKNDWECKADEYQYYDCMVKDLLSEMSSRKNGTTKYTRPMISPSKYCQAKQKLLAKIQSEQQSTLAMAESGSCNFKSMIKIQPKKESMVFRMSDYIADTVYDRKISSYIKFLYKVNFSNCIYSDLSLNNPGKTYKVKVGLGNNSELIKMLLKRRFWLEIDNSLQVGESKEENKLSFIWTQNTIDNVFKIQKSCVNCGTADNVTDTNSASINLSTLPEQSKKLDEVQKFTKRLKKLKKIEKKRDSFICNQKILNLAEVEQAQSHYAISNNGSTSIYTKMQPEVASNHIPSNFIIGSKKALFLLLHWYYENIKKIDPFTYLPKTYNIKSGEVSSPAFQKFLKSQSEKPDRVWIVKPGENTNRGNGINVASFSEVSRLIKKRQVHKNGEEKTYIIQKYLKPFLYNGRKFDIRHYMMITSVKGNIKAYWYREGYIRTSSEKYDLEDLGNQFIHLTNDAIQKKSELYGKYQPGNKLSYSNFQRYLDQNYPQKKYSFQTQILKKMKEITTDLIHASFSFLDPDRRNHNFQLYGMDFMINNKFEPYLIEVNANPCLEVSCPVLERIIPTLVQHTFRLALDPLFPPPEHYPVNCRYQLSDRILQKLKFQLIFDEKIEGPELRQKIDGCETKFTLSKQMIEPDQQIFQDEGQNPQNFEID